MEEQSTHDHMSKCLNPVTTDTRRKNPKY